VYSLNNRGITYVGGFVMKLTLATLCLTLAVLLGSAGVSWSADYQKGYAAYQSGDYATALREWEPLAEQGDASKSP